MTKEEIDHAAKQVLNALPMSEGSSEWALAHAAITKALAAACAAGRIEVREDAVAARDLRKWAIEQAHGIGTDRIADAALIEAFVQPNEQPTEP